MASFFGKFLELFLGLMVTLPDRIFSSNVGRYCCEPEENSAGNAQVLMLKQPLSLSQTNLNSSALHIEF